uniref:Uncharacterized protein n=1 Tax=Megaviridae environmental sample TaxID=1737588 RepID=A0A5J6VLJ6_9VIRU|nr:MAG: hypothetical protein [Megaviridae environmental sample]
MIDKKNILNLSIIILSFLIEYTNLSMKKITPLHSISKEIFLLYITMSMWRNLNNKFIKYQGLAGFWLHFARLLIRNKQFLNIELKYQILGGISIIMLYNKYTLVFEPFIRLFITYKTYNILGYNPLIDIPVILSHMYIILFKNNVLKKSTIIKNFYYANLIYHIFEIILFFSLNTQ